MLELMIAGMTIDEILLDYIDLQREDLPAVLPFPTRLSQIKELLPSRHEISG
jgi:uncharacterized protein (DUF433 family)